jgi:hypothetical protein
VAPGLARDECTTATPRTPAAGTCSTRPDSQKTALPLRRRSTSIGREGHAGGAQTRRRRRDLYGGARPPSEETAALEALGLAEDGARSDAAEAADDRHGAIHAWANQPLAEADANMLGQQRRGWLRGRPRSRSRSGWMRKGDKKKKLFAKEKDKKRPLFRTTQSFPQSNLITDKQRSTRR